MRVVQRGEQLGRRERAGVMAGAGDAAEPDRLLANEPGAVLEEAPADVASAALRPVRHRHLSCDHRRLLRSCYMIYLMASAHLARTAGTPPHAPPSDRKRTRLNSS